MNKKIIGIDFRDDTISCVVLGQKAGQRYVIAYDFIDLNTPADFSTQLGELLKRFERLDYENSRIVSNLPLASCSIRNLKLPFSNTKQIKQTLPFELEDQLIHPVNDQVIEYSITEKTHDGCRLFVAGIEKEIIQQHLQSFMQLSIDPEILTLRELALAQQYIDKYSLKNDLLFLNIDQFRITITGCHNNQIVFLRHLTQSNQLPQSNITDLHSDNAESDRVVPDSSTINSLSRSIQTNLNYARLASGIELQPEKIILTDTTFISDSQRQEITNELGFKVEQCDLQQLSELSFKKDKSDSWNPDIFNHALALALTGFNKKTAFNFRKGEFSPKKKLLRSRRQRIAASASLFVVLCALLGWLWFDCRRLELQDSATKTEMARLFRKTFPDKTKIVDPILQMESEMQKLQAPSVNLPIFSEEKRILNIIADISKRIPRSLSLEVTRLIIDQESVLIKAFTSTFNNVDTIQNQLINSGYYSNVDIVSANADKKSGKIRFQIHMDLGASSL